MLGQPREQEEVFVRHLGGGQDPDLLGPVAPERLGQHRGGLIPRGFHGGAPALPREGGGEAAVIVDPAEAVAAGVADPPPVHVRVEPGLDARHAAALVVMDPPAVGV